MQFPNCTAKVSGFFRVRKQLRKNRAFYNIVLEIERIVYTYKHF